MRNQPKHFLRRVFVGRTTRVWQRLEDPENFISDFHAPNFSNICTQHERNRMASSSATFYLSFHDTEQSLADELIRQIKTAPAAAAFRFTDQRSTPYGSRDVVAIRNRALSERSAAASQGPP